jgi:hypothetical protein
LGLLSFYEWSFFSIVNGETGLSFVNELDRLAGEAAAIVSIGAVKTNV